MTDSEITITIDMKKFPRECWTGEDNPFLRLDEHQLDDVEQWIYSLTPRDTQDHKVYCAEVIGRMPTAVAMTIGAVLNETGCLKLVHVSPGHGNMVVWDYTRGE